MPLLSAYPGVLRCMSLTLQQIFTVLGTHFELYENTAQGYDIYRFPDYGLVLEYDSISEKLSTIWVNDTPYYVYSGTIKSFDIDNDGSEEIIAAYEDANLNGRVTVFSKDGSGHCGSDHRLFQRRMPHVPHGRLRT